MRALAGTMRLDDDLVRALHPHEETHLGHLERVQSMVSGGGTPPLLLLIRDPRLDLWESLRDCEAGEPVWDERRRDGEERLFLCDGRELLEEARSRLLNHGGMIADGHHRFQVLRHLRQHSGESPAMPVCLANLSDAPPVLLPGHLMLSFRKAEQAAIERAVESKLRLAYGPVPVRAPLSSPEAVADRLAELAPRRGILLARSGDQELRGFVPRDEQDATAPLARIATLLDLETAARRQNLSRTEDYSASIVYGTERALAGLTRTTTDLVLCLPSLPAIEIFEQALHGKLQPPKTTYFHPKPPGVDET